MKSAEQKRALESAIETARTVGVLLRKNLNSSKKINSSEQHDVKLELDVRSQKIITQSLFQQFPDISVLGEEGVSGDQSSVRRWVVDPIDGTVNFTYGIPHCCISIALQERREMTPRLNRPIVPDDAYETLAGVVYDPFSDEMWTAARGGPARLNGRVIKVSRRVRLEEAMVSVGFAKSSDSLATMLPRFNALIPKVRKIRLMGAAALAIVYVAGGRFDAYWECGLRLWDIAAAGLIVECAGGEFWREPLPGDHVYHLMANNGLIRKKLERAARTGS
jgi:myo-inositol-1(or 4)-monophosphatase